jgi:hypothetical protein
MPSSLVPGAVFAAAIWVIFALAMIGPTPIRPSDHIWVATSSDKNPLHPTLARAAHPVMANPPAGTNRELGRPATGS